MTGARAAGIAGALLLAAMLPAGAANERADLPWAVRPCAVCHGYNGLSDQPGIPHLAGQKAEFIVKQVQVMRASALARLYPDPNLMPPYIPKPSHATEWREHRDNRDMDRQVASLTDDLVHLIAQFFAAKPRLCRSAAIPRGAPPVLTVRCGVCHGLNGESDLRHVPTLAGQHRLYLADQIRKMRSAARGEVFIGADTTHSSRIMGSQSILMSEAQIDELADWYANTPCAR